MLGVANALVSTGSCSSHGLADTILQSILIPIIPTWRCHSSSHGSDLEAYAMGCIPVSATEYIITGINFQYEASTISKVWVSQLSTGAEMRALLSSQKAFSHAPVHLNSTLFHVRLFKGEAKVSTNCPRTDVHQLHWWEQDNS